MLGTKSSTLSWIILALTSTLFFLPQTKLDHFYNQRASTSHFEFLSQDTHLSILSQHKAFLPLFLKYKINDYDYEDPPSDRWEHTVGSTLSVRYYYDSSVPSYSIWRPAYSNGIQSWDSADTLINFVYDGSSRNSLNVEYAPNETIGWTVVGVIDGFIYEADCIVNQWWEITVGLTNNQRRSVATHELGHLQGLEHLPSDYPNPSIMLYSYSLDELNIIYTPQSDDIILVNQVYP